MSDMRLYSVNWQDGMLITQKHLRDQEKYFEGIVRWQAMQGGDRWGLMRKTLSGQSALGLNLAVNGRRLRVELSRCQAVTPDGSLIDIDAGAGEIVRGEIDLTEDKIPVYVGVDPVLKKQVGTPDAAEDLPRVPFLMNHYVLGLGQPPSLPEGCFIQVAELVTAGDEVKPDPEFYPPCLAVNAEEKIAGAASDLRNRLETLLNMSTRAYMAITEKGVLTGESTSLQAAFKETVNQFIYHLATTLDDFVIGANAVHPLAMMVIFKKMFRVFSTMLNLHPGLKDYLNEKLFSRQGEDVGQFLSAIDGFLLSEYSHKFLGGQIRSIINIMDKLRDVFAFLAQTKRSDLGEQAVASDMLTYSGKTYRNVEYGSSVLEQVGELSYLMVSIPDGQALEDTVILMAKNMFRDEEWRSMQVRLGTNDARGLGETDPVDVDMVAFNNKVALHPRDMLASSSVRQVTLIFRSVPDPAKFDGLGKTDLIIYAV